MLKQLHLILLHWMCKHDEKMIRKHQMKFKMHVERFQKVYNKGFKERTGDNDT